jgi:hypothetical protein
MSGAGKRKPLRSRDEYRHFHILQTRWQDNDANGYPYQNVLPAF